MPTCNISYLIRLRKTVGLPLLCGLLLVLVMASSAFAQTFSGLSGTVSDASKASVKGAKVTVTSLETGTVRVATTSTAGFYSFPDLLVGHYSVRVEATGFQSELNPGVKLDGSVSASINFSLKPGDVTSTVDVEAIGIELDRTSSAVGNTFDTQQLENLPINDRDYMRFTELAAGATFRSQSIGDITFDGVGEYGNHFYIDGVDDTILQAPYVPIATSRGARLSNGSQESIAEFHILANGYPAEYGRAEAGVVNVISKAGTNHWHGEAFDYFRNEALDARNYFATFAKYPSKPRFRYNDFGGNIGGPIRRDNTFVFFNYEGDRQHLGAVTSGTVLSSTARAQALAAHPGLAPLIAAEPVGVDSPTNSQLANASASGVNNVSENDYSLRIDHNFTQKDSLFVRYNYNQSVVNGPEYAGSASAAATFFGVDENQYVPSTVTNVAVHEQHIFSSKLINDALAGFERYYVDTNQVYSTPRVTITGVSITPGNLGNVFQFNNGFQYGDAMTLVLNRHTLKFGSTFYRIQLNYKSVNTALVQFTSVNNFINDIVNQVTLSAGDPGNGTRLSEISSYVQDTWQARPNLTFDYGVRWDVQTTPHDKTNSLQAYSPASGTLFSPGHQYYNVDVATFGPRVGVAYSLNPRTVIRAGSGLFFQNQTSIYPQSVYANTLSGNLTLTLAGNPGLTYPYTAFTNGTAPIPSVYGFPANKPDPFTAQYNVSLAEEIGHGLYAQLAYVGLQGVDQERLEDLNVYHQGATVRPNPNFSSIYVPYNNSEINYNSLQATMKGRIKQLKLDLHYTWAHEIDDASDLGGVGANEPQDYNNIAAERSGGSQDQRQNFNYNLTYDIPVGAGHGFLGSSVAPVRALASGWSVNSLGIFTSGTLFNITQSINTYGNSNLVNQRPNIVAGAARYLPTTVDPTDGNVRFLNPGAWAYPTAYTAANPSLGQFGNSPRDPVHGPHFTDVDFALKKATKIHENQELDFKAEFFNIFNHPNFANPVAAYAPTSTTFGEINSTFGGTVGFGTSRNIQFALKYSF